MNTAIIVAAGSGTRFGAEKPKQFIEIHGKPLLIHTLEKFEQCAAVDEICLILSESEIAAFRRTLATFYFTKISNIAAGGATRAESVRRGLQSLAGREIEIVAVHDGARPLVTAEEIARTIEKARETGAACLTATVTDTIKKVSDGAITGTIDRENLRRALTPQCFRREMLERAFAPGNFDAAATDECFLVEKLGVQIAFVEGSGRNIKITTPEDRFLAEIFLQ